MCAERVHILRISSLKDIDRHVCVVSCDAIGLCEGNSEEHSIWNVESSNRAVGRIPA